MSFLLVPFEVCVVQDEEDDDDDEDDAAVGKNRVDDGHGRAWPSKAAWQPGSLAATETNTPLAPPWGESRCQLLWRNLHCTIV